MRFMTCAHNKVEPSKHDMCLASSIRLNLFHKYEGTQTKKKKQKNSAKLELARICKAQ